MRINNKERPVHNKRFLSLAEKYGKLDNIVICQRKEAPKR